MDLALESQKSRPRIHARWKYVAEDDGSGSYCLEVDPCPYCLDSHRYGEDQEWDLEEAQQQRGQFVAECKHSDRNGDYLLVDDPDFQPPIPNSKLKKVTPPATWQYIGQRAYRLKQQARHLQSFTKEAQLPQEELERIRAVSGDTVGIYFLLHARAAREYGGSQADGWFKPGEKAVRWRRRPNPE